MDTIRRNHGVANERKSLDLAAKSDLTVCAKADERVRGLDEKSADKVPPWG
jgi:hypothetical protein